MGTSRCFQDVEFWKKAHQWVLGLYQITARFPKEELFALTSQLRRAAVSVPANFVEGFRKQTFPDKARFYNIAQSSIAECQYYLILARDLKYADATILSQDSVELDVMLDAYIHGMKRNERSN